MKIVALGLLLSALTVAPALAQGDPKAGETIFKRCASCHSIGEGATNKVGPVLNGVLGRTAGTAPDYKYSEAMVAAGQGGLVWTPETLTPFLHDPKATVPGTKMSFPGLKKDDEVANVIAYLATFSPDYQPGAAPAAPAAPAAAPAQ
jgi:cytochrome c